MHIKLPFVITASPGKDFSVLDYRIEWPAMPELKWIGRLNVVVPINKNCRFLRINDLFAIDDRVTFGLIYFCFVNPGIQQTLLHRFGAPDHIRLVFASCTHT